MKELVKNYGVYSDITKIRSTFCTDSTLCKLHCKPKDRVAASDKNNKVVHMQSSFIPRKKQIRLVKMFLPIKNGD